MVLQLTPLGNATHPCSGLERYNAGRALEPSPSYYPLSITAAAISFGLTFVTYWGVVRYRNSPRFAKVRPVSTSILLSMALNMYVVGGIVAVPFQLPCVVSVLLFPTAVSWIIAGLVLRAMTLSLESQQAKAARGVVATGGGTDVKAVTPYLLDAEDRLPSSPSQIQLGPSAATAAAEMSESPSSSFVFLSSWRRDLYGVGLLYRVAFGTKPLADMELGQIALSKHVLFWFTLLLMAPNMLGTWLLFGLVPQTHNECAGVCRDVFFELPIMLVFMLATSSYVIFQSVLVAYRNVGWDSKGVVLEIMLIPLLVGLPCVVSWIVIIVDPNDWGYNRVFNWHLLCMPPGLCYWWVCFGGQFLKAERIAKLQQQSAETYVMVNMQRACDQDAQLRADFYNFAVRHICAELVLFMEDAREYKRAFFDDKSENRLRKAKLLVKTYVANGADMEINISGECRKRILARYEQVSLENDSLFDQAAGEVEEMLQHGVWSHFLAQRRKQLHTADNNSWQLFLGGIMSPAAPAAPPGSPGGLTATASFSSTPKI